MNWIEEIKERLLHRLLKGYQLYHIDGKAIFELTKEGFLKTSKSKGTFYLIKGNYKIGIEQL